MADQVPCIEVGRAVRREPSGAPAATAAAEEALAAVRVHRPSAVLVFASVQHDLPGVLRAVRRAVGEVPILGTTTAGEICDGMHHGSVVVTVLASPHLSAHVGVAAEVSRDWSAAVDAATQAPGLRDYFGPNPTAWQRLAREARSAFAFVLSPGATQRAETKGYPIIELLKRRSLGRLPIFGMSASDEMRFEQNYVLAGDQVVPDGLLVAVFETQLRFGVAMAHGFQPVGRSALVTAAEANEVVQLDGRPAADVYAELIDVPRQKLDGAFVARATRTLIGIPGALGSYVPNAATYVTPRGGLRFAIPIPPGQTVSRIVSGPATATSAGPEALAKAAARGGIARPALAVMCTCAIRPLLLGDGYPEEVPSMVAALQGAPLVGMVSCGEAGPADDGVPQHMNAVLGALVLGDELSSEAQVARENEGLRRRAEEIHRQSREELERLVAERTGQLEAANARLRGEIDERRRLQRAWRTLSECNAAVARAEDEPALLREVCRILVEVGGYRMSCVGLTGSGGEGRLEPAACAGHAEGHLSELQAWLTPDGEPGPLRRAARTGMPVVLRNLKTSPEFLPWRDAAIQRGYASMIALPLVSAGTAFGCLVIFGGESGALDAAEITLLSDLASNLAFGATALRDRAERSRIAAHLVQADRLVAMGTLAAGVGHEINNPLSYATSGLKELAAMIDEGLAGAERAEEARAITREVAQGLERIRQAVRDLKLFSRGDDARRRPLEIPPVLESTLRLAHNDLRHRARLVRAYGPLPLISASEAQLGQVFLNLVVRACRAMPDGAADRNELRVVTYTDPGGWAVVEFHDTGPDLSPAERARAFDPFASGSPAQGLGLAVCKSVVASMGGEISADAEPGKGTAFRVRFPPAFPEEDDEAAAPTPAPAAPRRARVLVIDDEALVARSLQRMLAREHEVVVETSSAEALARLEAGERFDVILCDVMMPQLSGPEFHAQLRRSRPELARRVVFVTGGAFSPGAARYLEDSGSRVLEKPFEAQDVLALVRKLLP